MKLSIIIPHKDDLDSLARLLEQIPDDNDIEVIVVDDNSEVSPQHLVESKPNANLLLSPGEPPGAGTARNAGLTVAQGEWILFADADDQFLPRAFELLRQHFHSSAEVIYFRPTATHALPDREANRHHNYVHLIDHHLDTGSEWIRYRFHPPWSKLIRLSLIKKHDFRFDECIAGNDLNFSLQVGLAAKTIQATTQSIYCVTQGNPGSLTSQQSRTVLSARFESQCRYNDILRRRDRWKYRMTLLPLLRKAWKVSPAFFGVLFVRTVSRRQPLFDNWRHLYSLWSQRHSNE